LVRQQAGTRGELHEEADVGVELDLRRTSLKSKNHVRRRNEDRGGKLGRMPGEWEGGWMTWHFGPISISGTQGNRRSEGQTELGEAGLWGSHRMKESHWGSLLHFKAAHCDRMVGAGWEKEENPKRKKSLRRGDQSVSKDCAVFSVGTMR